MRFTTTIRMLVVMAAIAVLLPGLMLAQSLTQGAISGTVTDSTGAIVPNITVKLNSLDAASRAIPKTNAQGTFQFPHGRLGSYQVWSISRDLGDTWVRSRLPEGTRPR